MFRHALAITAACFAASSHAQDTPPATYDCGVLTGLHVAAETLSAGRESRSMDVYGWLSRFENNTNRQDKLSAGLASASQAGVTASTANVLNTLKITLDGTVRGGQGDAFYWRDMVDAQYRNYRAVRDSLAQLKTTTCGGR